MRYFATPLLAGCFLFINQIKTALINVTMVNDLSKVVFAKRLL
jgi:hypothetical protein